MKSISCAVVISILFAITKCEYIPVLIWQPADVDGRGVESPPSMSKVSAEQFSDYFSKMIRERKHIVVFLEENLSMEDFGSLSLDDRSSFSSLKNITSSSNVNFLPSVQSPFKALKTLGLKIKSVNPKEFDYTFPSTERSVLVFKLGDARPDEDRPDFLKRHDTTIGDVYNNLINKDNDLIAVYTGYHSSWTEPYLKPTVRKVRQLLQSVIEEGDASTFWNKSSTLLYSKLPPLYRSPTEEINITNEISVTTSSKASALSVSVRADNVSLKLTFNQSRGYWYFEEVSVMFPGKPAITLYPKTEISAPIGFSYHCASNVVFGDADSNVTFFGLQVEAYTDSTDTFNDAYDCVPFFSAPIWSGIFVTAILAFIMIWALTMIMDIKTMDQFDNPKGKTITINATD